MARMLAAVLAVACWTIVGAANPQQTFDYDCPVGLCARPPPYPPLLTVAIPPQYFQPNFQPDPAHAPSSRIWGLDDMVIKPQIPTAFSVTAMKDAHTPCATGNHTLKVKIHGLGDTHTGQTYDLKNGSYIFYIIAWYSPSIRDEAIINVTIGGVPVAGSPYRVPVELSGERARIAADEAATKDWKPCEDFVIVTGADSGMFERLENLVGSIHFWQGPRQKIIVYDFGLWEEDARDAHDWRNVEFRKFPVDQYPPHVLKLGENCTYAFKAFILTNLTKEYDCIFWLDAGIELRQRIDVIENAIARYGYFYTTNGWPWPNMFCYPPSLDYWGFTEESIRGPNGEVWLARAGGIQGYRRGSEAAKYVLPLITDCAMDPLCIDPAGANKKNFRQDQTVLNLVLVKPGPYMDRFRPHSSKDFWSQEPDNTKDLTKDEKQSNNLVIYVRRSFLPKPYFHHVRLRSVPYFDEWQHNTDITYKDEFR